MLIDLKKGSEKKLLDVLAGIKDDPAGYYAAYFNFSELLEHNKNESKLRISINIINDILSLADGYISICSDNDLVILCNNTPLNLITKTIFQLRYLYLDDPLAYYADGKENEDFCRLYELRFEWDNVFSALREKVTHMNSKAALRPVMADDTELTPARLVSLETELNKTNITSAVRSQPVCVLKAEGFKTIYDETYINMGALNQLLRVAVDFGSERSLFKYLTNILDRKMLEYIAKTQHRNLKSAISMNINVSTVLSKYFAEFSRNIGEKIRRNMIIEIQLSDVFSDMQAFVAAKEMLHEMGYRVCLDGLTNLSIIQVDRNSLGFDLAKIFWNADIKFDARRKENQQLAEAIDRCGKSRVILARCDNKDAIYYGQAVGVSLFQGRYIDSIIAPDAKIIN